MASLGQALLNSPLKGMHVEPQVDVRVLGEFQGLGF